jgi:hypothetical protein
MKDEDFKNYLFRYYHNGSWWAFVVPAASEEDARERIRLMARAQLDGVIEATYKLPNLPGMPLVAALICWWKNKSIRWALKKRE